MRIVLTVSNLIRELFQLIVINERRKKTESSREETVLDVLTNANFT